MADLLKIFNNCEVCGEKYRFGQGRYDGRVIPDWGIQICDMCDKGNWDGMVPSSHPELIKKLKEKGVKLKYNVRGLIVIP